MKFTKFIFLIPLLACGVAFVEPDSVDPNPVPENMASVLAISSPRFEITQNEDGSATIEDHSSSASGVVVGSDGYILTCWHVVDGAEELYVNTDGGVKPALVVAKDELLDLALVKIPASGLRCVTWGDSGALEVGDRVVAIGFPFSLGKMADAGIVSALDGTFDYPVITTDAAINPGHSGGGLFNQAGELIGINNMIYAPYGFAANVGLAYAIPGNVAHAFVVAHMPRGVAP